MKPKRSHHRQPPQAEQTRAKLEAELERRRVVQDYERSLVEVPVYRYRRLRSRSEMHQQREERER